MHLKNTKLNVTDYWTWRLDDSRPIKAYFNLQSFSHITYSHDINIQSKICRTNVGQFVVLRNTFKANIQKTKISCTKRINMPSYLNLLPCLSNSFEEIVNIINKNTANTVLCQRIGLGQQIISLTTILKLGTGILWSIVVKGLHTIFENFYVRITRYTIFLASDFSFLKTINLEETCNNITQIHSTTDVQVCRHLACAECRQIVSLLIW